MAEGALQSKSQVLGGPAGKPLGEGPPRDLEDEVAFPTGPRRKGEVVTSRWNDFISKAQER